MAFELELQQQLFPGLQPVAALRIQACSLHESVSQSLEISLSVYLSVSVYTNTQSHALLHSGVISTKMHREATCCCAYILQTLTQTWLVQPTAQLCCMVCAGNHPLAPTFGRGGQQVSEQTA